MNRIWLRLEGLLMGIASTSAYFFHLEGNWVWFVLLFFLPDLSIIGYRISPRFGAKAYNLFHTTVFPLILLMVGWFVEHDGSMMIALIWLAHIGIDRVFGFGLKYPTTFKDTHLQRL